MIYLSKFEEQGRKDNLRQNQSSIAFEVYYTFQFRNFQF